MVTARDKDRIERAGLIGDWIGRVVSAVLVAVILFAVISRYI